MTNRTIRYSRLRARPPGEQWSHHRASPVLWSTPDLPPQVQFLAFFHWRPLQVLYPGLVWWLQLVLRTCIRAVIRCRIQRQSSLLDLQRWSVNVCVNDFVEKTGDLIHLLLSWVRWWLGRVDISLNLLICKNFSSQMAYFFGLITLCLRHWKPVWRRWKSFLTNVNWTYKAKLYDTLLKDELSLLWMTFSGVHMKIDWAGAVIRNEPGELALWLHFDRTRKHTWSRVLGQEAVYICTYCLKQF